MFKKEGRNLIENNALNHTAPLISGESRPWDNLAGELGLQKKLSTVSLLLEPLGSRFIDV